MSLNKIAVAIALSIAPTAVHAQLARTRDPAAAGIATGSGVPRDPQHPYAGLWAGVRTLPLGSDDFRLRYSVNNDRYDGVMLLPDGHRAPQKNLTMTADGLSWDSPNSGGGTWEYHAHLASPDSLVGTLVLRDAPPNLQPAPRGTIVLKRQPPERTRQP